MSVARLLLLGLVVLHASPRAQGCTSFCIEEEGHVVYGKNYDWDVGDGWVMVNKRGVEKSALLEPGAPGRAATWTSRYGSVTFNQFGRDVPNGGMNEEGLVVEVMWLDEARYPAPDARPEIGVLGWVQYQLDRFATVDEVLENAPRLRIASSVPLHYLVCDRTGECTSIELLEGKLVHDAARVLTNHTYRASAEHARAVARRTAPLTEAERLGSLERFVTASGLVASYDASGDVPPVDYAFSVLRATSDPRRTQWSIVYDMSALRVHFRTLWDSSISRLELGGLDFSCAAPVQILDLSGRRGPDVGREFVPYTTAANRKLVAGVYGRIDFLAGYPEPLLEAIARHPESSRCSTAPAR